MNRLCNQSLEQRVARRFHTIWGALVNSLPTIGLEHQKILSEAIEEIGKLKFDGSAQTFEPILANLALTGRVRTAHGLEYFVNFIMHRSTLRTVAVHWVRVNSRYRVIDVDPPEIV